MKRVTRTTIHAALLGALIATAPFAAQAQDKANAIPFTEAQQEALDKAIHDYLMDNPRTIMDSVEQYRQNQEMADMQAFAKKIKDRHEEIYNDPATPVAGNPQGDVTLVEFFDYNCGYCKQAFRDIQTLIDEDKNLRVVFKEIPILSESSHMAARYALAADKQGKYWEYHTGLMSSAGQLNQSRLESIAKNVGLDVNKLKADAETPEIRVAIEKNLDLARDIGITGTPGFVLGDEALRGHYGLEILRKFIQDQHARQNSGKADE